MAKSLRMHQIKRIIELQQQGCWIRQTVRLTGLARNTIREYLSRISTAGDNAFPSAWDGWRIADRHNRGRDLSPANQSSDDDGV